MFQQLKKGSWEARQLLATKYLPYIKNRASVYGRYKDDIVSQTCINVLKQLEEIRQGRECKLESVVPLISQSIKFAIVEILNDKLIRIPRRSKARHNLTDFKQSGRNPEYIEMEAHNEIDLLDAVEAVNFTPDEKAVFDMIFFSDYSMTLAAISEQLGFSISKIHKLKQVVGSKILEVL